MAKNAVDGAANLRGSHDQAQIQAEGCDPLNSSKDRQARVSQAIGASIIQTSSKTRYQARPHHCDATDVYGRNECSDHDCYRLAAVFGPRLSCRWRATPPEGSNGSAALLVGATPSRTLRKLA
jgi:hypothetical protein